jgi:hypothetical protein
MFGLGAMELLVLACIGIGLVAGLVYMFMRRQD